MALADKTRLRILNLMRDDEVCVYFLTVVIGSSQPKVSRHLAYLRNAGLVEARRDGKWMFYRVLQPNDASAETMLNDLFNWLDNQKDLQRDQAKYQQILRNAHILFRRNSASPKPREPIGGIPAGNNASAQKEIFLPQITKRESTAHNELEDFLL